MCRMRETESGCAWARRAAAHGRRMGGASGGAWARRARCMREASGGAAVTHGEGERRHMGKGGERQRMRCSEAAARSQRDIIGVGRNRKILSVRGPRLAWRKIGRLRK